MIEKTSKKIIILNSTGKNTLVWVAYDDNSLIYTKEILSNGNRIVSQIPIQEKDFYYKNKDGQWTICIDWNQTHSDKHCFHIANLNLYSEEMSDIFSMFRIMEYNKNIEDFQFATNHTIEDLQKQREQIFGIKI